ncbi:putative ATP phosphoribosyltransferase [Rosa chinensis]|uniref:Putative ATP phosphoribosyltransferase n=1 Tax=Rosa chinensis TaxID=74649 RepID=A0A2P6S1J2_ROSCH|nr:putative ATP phosphoribosyltransferase [Rosa chinensis]
MMMKKIVSYHQHQKNPIEKSRRSNYFGAGKYLSLWKYISTADGALEAAPAAVLVASKRSFLRRKNSLDATREILERLDANRKAEGTFMVFANMSGNSAQEVCERVLSQPLLSGLRSGGSEVIVIPSSTYTFDEETPRWPELLSKLGL